MNNIYMPEWEEAARLSAILLDNIKSKASEIDALATRFDKNEPDAYYRFYHYSFKIFSRQDYIRDAIELFESIAPEGRSINPWFKTIVNDALSQTFDMHRTNENWLAETRPILEAYAHCAAFLRALKWTAENLDESPQLLPAQWALTLYLFNCR